MTLYEVLGISSSATGDEIKHAYRRQAMRWHPDRNPNNKEEAERRFKEVGYAYSILSDPAKRREYDDALRSQESFDDGTDFSDESAFSIFLATVLDMAFELALKGADSITIFRTLVTEGCPQTIAQIIAQRAYTMAQRSSPQGAKTSTDSRAHYSQPSPPKPPPTSKPVHNPDVLGVSPWRRWWAKMFDLSLVGIVVYPTWTWVIANGFVNSGFKAFVAFFALSFLPFLFLGVLGGIFGNTPGKSLLAILVRREGRNLTVAEYVMRELSIWLRGFWCCIPFLTLIPQFLSFRTIRIHGRSTSWDERGGFDVVSIRDGKARIVAYVLSLVFVPLISSVLSQAALKASVRLDKPPQVTQSPVQHETAKATVPPPVQPTSYRRIAFGVVAPMTGPQAHLGVDIERGARLGIDELNRKQLKVNGDVLTFELVVGDDQADPAVAPQVAKRMVASGVTAVIGHMNSGTSIPAAKIYSEAGVVQISPSSTNPRLTELGYSTAFRLMANDHQQGKALGDFASILGVKTVVIVDDRSVYGQILADAFRNRTETLGIKTLANAYIDAKSPDFRGVLRTIVSARPDLVFLGGMDTQGGPLVKQIKDAGINALFLGGDGVCTPEFMKLAGSASNGHYCSLAGMPIEVPENAKSFHSLFKSRYGEIQLYAPHAYDAALVLGQAIQSARSTEPVEIIRALKSVEMAGIMQNYRFSSNGDLISAPVSIYQYRIPHLEYRETLFLR